MCFVKGQWPVSLHWNCNRFVASKHYFSWPAIVIKAREPPVAVSWEYLAFRQLFTSCKDSGKLSEVFRREGSMFVPKSSGTAPGMSWSGTTRAKHVDGGL